MKRVLLSILLVLNILCLNAQDVRFISVNESIDSPENITSNRLSKHLQKDTLRPDTLTASAKWMLKLQKKLSKQQNRDSNIYIYICPSSQDSVTAYLPLSGKYGYVLFDTAKTGVVEIQTWQKKISIYKYQWDLIHDPQTMLFAWGMDEEEGAAYGNNCLFTEWIEKIRYASHHNLSILKKSGISESVKNIRLSDNSFISDLRIYSRDGFNAKIFKSSDNIVISNRTGQNMVHFQFGKQIGFSGSYPVYELEIITTNKDKAKVEGYLFNKENWNSKVRQHFFDRMLEGRESAIDFMNCLPDEYYTDLDILQRMDILFTLNDAKNIKEHWFGGADEEGIVIQTIKTTPKNQISDFFDRLEKDNLIVDLYNKIHDVFGKDNQTRFMSELLLLYYSQPQDYLQMCATSSSFFLPWVQRPASHFYTYKIENYSAEKYGYLSNTYYTPIKGDIVISADYSYLTGVWNTESNTIKPMVAKPFQCMAVYFYTPVEFIGVENMALPMPAIFFKWMVEEVVERQLETATEFTLKVAQVAIPGTQLIIGTKSVASAIIAIASIIHATANLFIEISDVACTELNTSQSAEKFCSLWENLGLTTSTASNLEDAIGAKIPLFYILCFTWDNMLNDPDLSLKQTLGENDYAKINTTISQIKKILND